MAKRSKPTGKGESKTPIKDKTPIKEDAITDSDNEETITSGKGGERFDFFYVLAGGGALIGVILIIFIILRYVLHMV